MLYSVILLITLMVFSVLTIIYSHYQTNISVEREISASADVISKFLMKIQNLNDLKYDSFDLSQSVAYSIFDHEKKLVYSNRPDLQYMQLLHEESGGSRRGTAFKHYNSEDETGSEEKVIFTNRELKIKESVYYLQVAGVTNLKGAFPRILLIISLLGSIVCYISGKFLTQRFLMPIRDITKTAKDITSENLDKRIIIGGPQDELKELADTFNSMIERLENDFEKQRRFISDVSHELRTPLSVIYGNVNMLGRWGKSDPVVMENSLEVMKRETEVMNKLIEDLLYLARGDSNTLALRKTRFPLDVLLKEVFDEAMLVHNEFSSSIRCEAGCSVYADYNSLKQVLRNLIENSIKYSSSHCDIKIDVIRENNGVKISVTDQGIGIPPEDLPHIFDRFYRVDESRSKATGGNGLGLSIVKQIVQCHNGSIQAESVVGRGTSIIVFLPDEE